MFTVLIFGQTHIVTFTVLYHFRSSYKVVFSHLYSVMLTILLWYSDRAFNKHNQKKQELFETGFKTCGTGNCGFFGYTFLGFCTAQIQGLTDGLLALLTTGPHWTLAKKGKAGSVFYTTNIRSFLDQSTVPYLNNTIIESRLRHARGCAHSSCLLHIFSLMVTF